MTHRQPQSRVIQVIALLIGLLGIGCQEEPEKDHSRELVDSGLLHEKGFIMEEALDLVLWNTSIDPKLLVETVLALSEEEVETQWAEYLDRFRGRERERHLAFIAQFDSVGDGVVDPDQLDDFVEAEAAIRRKQTQDLREYLLEQYDANGDGRLSRAELEEVFAAFRKIATLPSNSPREILARKTLELRLFDWEDKGFLTPSEWVAAGRLRREAFRGGDPDDTIAIPTPIRRRRIPTSSE